MLINCFYYKNTCVFHDSLVIMSAHIATVKSFNSYGILQSVRYKTKTEVWIPKERPEDANQNQVQYIDDNDEEEGFDQVTFDRTILDNKKKCYICKVTSAEHNRYCISLPLHIYRKDLKTKKKIQQCKFDIVDEKIEEDNIAINVINEQLKDSYNLFPVLDIIEELEDHKVNKAPEEHKEHNYEDEDEVFTEEYEEKEHESKIYTIDDMEIDIIPTYLCAVCYDNILSTQSLTRFNRMVRPIRFTHPHEKYESNYCPLQYMDMNNNAYPITNILTIFSDHMSREFYERQMCDQLSEMMQVPKRSLYNLMICDSVAYYKNLYTYILKIFPRIIDSIEKVSINNGLTEANLIKFFEYSSIMFKYVLFSITTYKSISDMLVHDIESWIKNPLSDKSRSLFPNIKTVLWLSMLVSIPVNKIRIALTVSICDDLLINKTNNKLKDNSNLVASYVNTLICCQQLKNISGNDLIDLIDKNGHTIPDCTIKHMLNNINAFNSKYITNNDIKMKYLIGWWKHLELNMYDGEDSIIREINQFLKYISKNKSQLVKNNITVQNEPAKPTQNDRKIKHEGLPPLDANGKAPRLINKVCAYCNEKFATVEELMIHIETEFKIKRTEPLFSNIENHRIACGCKSVYDNKFVSVRQTISDLTPEKIIELQMTKCPIPFCDFSDKIFTPQELCEHFKSMGIKSFVDASDVFQQDNEDDDCVSCLENRAIFKLYPCEHVNICKNCFETWNQTCMTCNQLVISHVKVN